MRRNSLNHKALALKSIAEGNNTWKSISKEVGLSMRATHSILTDLEKSGLILARGRRRINVHNTLPVQYELPKPDIKKLNFLDIIHGIFHFSPSHQNVKQFMLTEYYFRASAELSKIYEMLLVMDPALTAPMDEKKAHEITASMRSRKTVGEEEFRIMHEERVKILRDRLAENPQNQELQRWLESENENVIFLLQFDRSTEDQIKSFVARVTIEEQIENIKQNFRVVDWINDEAKKGGFGIMLLKELLISPGVAQYLYDYFTDTINELFKLIRLLPESERPKNVFEFIDHLSSLSRDRAQTDQVTHMDMARSALYEAMSEFDKTDAVISDYYLTKYLTEDIDRDIKEALEYIKP